MAEWSKALDLSSSIRKNAQVRTLLEAFPSKASVAQLAARRIHSPKVEGSTPSGGTFCFWSRLDSVSRSVEF